MPASKPVTLPALDPAGMAERTGSSYPEPYRAAVAGRAKWALGDAVGLTRYGVNLVRLPPGVASSQRHWHSHEDEFVYVLAGEVELITESGPQTLSAGMCAGFPAGRPDGHQLVNRAQADAVYLEIGDRDEADECHYPDIDLHLRPVDSSYRFTRKNGEPY